MKIFQKMKDFFVRISGFIRCSADFCGFFRFSADFFFFFFFFCKKFIFFSFIFGFFC